MTLLATKRKQDTAFWVIVVVATIGYALLSLVNHYLFKTYTLDLGVYTNALYDYAHFRLPDCSMFKARDMLMLCDHFDLYLVLLSPLVYVFGSWTLLIVQIAASILGGIGIYKLVGLYTDDHLLPPLAMIVFYFSFGIIQALAFDYHSNVVAAMLLPWLFWALKQRRFVLSSVLVVLFVIGKENMSLFLFFVAIGLMWDYRRDKSTMWHLAAYALFSLLYFVLINMVVMPKMGNSGSGFYRYAYLGDNYADIALNLISHPGETLRILFTNTTGNPAGDGLKEEFYQCALLSGMLLTLLKPNYLFVLLPLIGQKMFSSDRVMWGIAMQYSVEFVPILVVSSFMVIAKLKKGHWGRLLAVALLISTVATTFYTVGVPKAFVRLDHLCIYQGRHYEQSDFDAAFARELMKEIPDDASVCASSVFVPHLALREKIYDIKSSKTKEADYLMLVDSQTWEKVIDFEAYEPLSTDGTLTLWKRIRP